MVKSNRVYSGWYGIVAMVDNRTAVIAEELAEDILEFRGTKDRRLQRVTWDRAHITLFQHRNFKGLREKFVQDKLEELAHAARTMVSGQRISMDKIAVHSGNYFFWYADRGGLSDLHKKSLDLSQFVDPQSILELLALADAKQPALTKPQRALLETFGQMYVGYRFVPHITLMHIDQPDVFNTRTPMRYQHQGLIRSIAFVSHSTGGRIKEILAEVPL